MLTLSDRRKPAPLTVEAILRDIMQTHGPEGLILWMEEIVRHCDQSIPRRQARVRILNNAREQLKQASALYAPPLHGNFVDKFA